jgi:hypothetical protein
MAYDPKAGHAPENTAEKPTPTSRGNNISTDHQEKGDAKLPSDTLGREKGAGQDDGGRASSFLHPADETPEAVKDAPTAKDAGGPVDDGGRKSSFTFNE